MVHAQTAATDEVEEPDETALVKEPKESSGLGTEVYVGLLWLGISMYVAHATIASNPDSSGPLGEALAALPDLVVSTVVTAAGISLAAGSRFSSMWRRLPASLGAGVLFGVASAIGLRFAYGDTKSITLLALIVGLGSVFGGVLALLPEAVLGASLWATTWVFFLGVMSGVWHDPVTNMLGGGPTATASAQAAADVKFIYGMSIFAGLVSAFYSSRSLRNERPGWLWFGVAGALPGVMMVAGEYLTRLGGSSLMTLVHGDGADSSSLADLSDWGRLRHALIVLAVGGVIGLVAAARTLGDKSRT